MSLIATSPTRVAQHTASAVNRRIAFETHARQERINGRREAIMRQLRELDEEWNVERVIQANAASLVLAGTVLGLAPLPLVRRLGFRTEREIADERNILRAHLDALSSGD
ncbi:MAG: hypothetical protein H0W78_00855 [Planctomycetes bacterium]|nr:hypothetical protein [Planctomycetota bacterium]